MKSDSDHHERDHDHDEGGGRSIDGDGDDGYPRGWRWCFRKLRLSVRAMVDEEVPASAGVPVSRCVGFGSGGLNEPSLN
jgi:hypothetical protein